MYILGLETSAKAVSVCISQDETLVAQAFQATQLTHSRTLMAICEDLLKNAELTLKDIDVIAVASGPGSFTGLRIGVSACKGLAWSAEKPCVGVSTLEAMSWPLAHWAGMDICAVMDARRSQVYNALFTAQGETLERRTQDRAISIDQLAEELKIRKKPQILVGDGAQLCYNELIKREVSVSLAPSHLRLQSGWGVTRCAVEEIARGHLGTATDLEPNYHRVSQAERERLARANENVEETK